MDSVNLELKNFSLRDIVKAMYRKRFLQLWGKEFWSPSLVKFVLCKHLSKIFRKFTPPPSLSDPSRGSWVRTTWNQWTESTGFANYYKILRREVWSSTTNGSICSKLSWKYWFEVQQLSTRREYTVKKYH